MKNKMEIILQLEKTANILRQEIITMIYKAQSGHPGGSLSAADIITVLYFNIMNIDPENPNMENRDRFILSKGHACPAYYAALALRGYFPVEELAALRLINRSLQGHPDMRKTKGVDMTTGSLGQGLSAGIGMALAGKLNRKDYRVFVMLGDGELEEGQVWEAAMFASKYKLNNLCAIIDYNKLQIDGTIEEVMPLEPLSAKWKAFGWQVVEFEGHNIEQIIEALKSNESADKPLVLVAHTVKGKGVSFMENEPGWHGRVPTTDEFNQAIGELTNGKR